MKNTILILSLSISFACQYEGFTDLTPDDGFHTEYAFNVPELNRAIYQDTVVQDTGWHYIDPIPDIYTLNPFVYDIQYVTTDTFAFEWQDYKPVIRTVHRIANGFETTISTPARGFSWLNVSQFYSDGTSYLIPMFNSRGYRYWLQVFRKRVGYWKTYYAARGIWIISKPKPIDGDVS